jgi:cysteine desulfurase / selenocysteine lyase
VTAETDTAATASVVPTFDAARTRADFPALAQEVHGKSLVYLDNAATSQKPQSVIDAVNHFYRRDCSNVHRGAHELSARATTAYEATRGKVARWIGAPEERSVLFTRGTTEAINLVARSWGGANLKAGDRILSSEMEHHSNIVPWQLVAQSLGAEVIPIPVLDDGSLDMAAYDELLDERVKMVSVVHISNALGTVNPVEDIISRAHAVGAKVLLDGAQALPHQRVSVAALGCDFYAFSGHKLFAPTGIGCLWGRPELLEAMPPWHGGGDMIDRVSFSGTTYNVIPHKFEAGTPNIAGTIGLGAAIDYLESLDFAGAAAWEHRLLEEATTLLDAIEGIRIIGRAPGKAAVISFVMEGAGAQDIGTLLDAQGVAVRAGHHCTQPLMERFRVPATARASFAFYNDLEDVKRLASGLERAQRLFGATS